MSDRTAGLGMCRSVGRGIHSRQHSRGLTLLTVLGLAVQACALMFARITIIQPKQKGSLALKGHDYNDTVIINNCVFTIKMSLIHYLKSSVLSKRYYHKVAVNTTTDVMIIRMTRSRGFTFTWWGYDGLRLWYKLTELAHSFLVCFCVHFCLYGPFNCTSFLNSPDNSPFSHSLSYWSFELYITFVSVFSLCLIGPLNYTSLYKILLQPRHHP